MYSVANCVIAPAGVLRTLAGAWLAGAGGGGAGGSPGFCAGFAAAELAVLAGVDVDVVVVVRRCAGRGLRFRSRRSPRRRRSG